MDSVESASNTAGKPLSSRGGESGPGPEPLSGETGAGTRPDPYDAGNRPVELIRSNTTPPHARAEDRGHMDPLLTPPVSHCR